MQRRNFLQMMAGGLAALLLAPAGALAAIWNKAAFQSTDFAGAIAGLHIPNITPSDQIEVIAPDRAENGAVVQVEVRSHIPGSEAIMILVAKNPTSLIADFTFSNGADSFVVTRIKMAETDDVQAVVKAGDQYFSAKKNVVVLENGCN
ncbi:MAG TPA: thiosulfate oxidation carrier protein SoxY [Methylophilaceae bacterium]|nr:thiosulfate oxidation carrier protein SoxY [Methylophilaceae bacterium]